MTSEKVFFDCGIPNHPANYAHQHLGGWRDCVECQNHLDALAADTMSTGNPLPFQAAHRKYRDLDEYMNEYHAEHGAEQVRFPKGDD